MKKFTTSHLEEAVIEGSGLPPLFVGGLYTKLDEEH